jgi:hypothetical protein
MAVEQLGHESTIVNAIGVALALQDPCRSLHISSDVAGESYAPDSYHLYAL